MSDVGIVVIANQKIRGKRVRQPQSKFCVSCIDLGYPLRSSVARSLCQAHYQRQVLRGEPIGLPLKFENGKRYGSDEERTVAQKASAAIQMKSWRARNPERWRQISARSIGKRRLDKDWVEKTNQRSRELRTMLRHETFMAYGGLSCACSHDKSACGLAPIEHLSLDHIDGKNVDKSCRGGQKLYAKLKREGWPTGYRVLCHNCNMSIGIYGYCPFGEGNGNEA